MPTKTTTNGKKYDIDGKKFSWTTSTVDEEPVVVVLPLRLKVKVLRALSKQDTDIETILEMLASIAPTQADVFDELDWNDLTAMYAAWQDEYTKLTGASPGE